MSERTPHELALEAIGHVIKRAISTPEELAQGLGWTREHLGEQYVGRPIEMAPEVAAAEVERIYAKMRSEARVAHYLGWGTNAWEKLVAAVAALRGQPQWMIEAEYFKREVVPNTPELLAIDLDVFCAKATQAEYDTREYLSNPWSVGVHTVATDAKTLIRVPRRDDVPENPHAPRIEPTTRIFDAAAPFGPLPALPAPVLLEDGTEAFKTCRFLNRKLNLAFLRRFVGLPGIEVDMRPGTLKPGHEESSDTLCFRFAGGAGIGLLQPLLPGGIAPVEYDLDAAADPLDERTAVEQLEVEDPELMHGRERGAES